MSKSFVQLGVPEDLEGVLRRRGIESPFPIQEATLPDALAGRDICGRAPTGSGKTLAFGLALVTNTPKAKPRRPTALVLVPTRELAAQVARELEPLATARKLSVATVYGGTSYEPQRRALRRGTDILVACPGRLEDLLEQGDLALSDSGIVVVDEADRMADMGFLPAVKRLLDATKRDRQTLLFSATLDGDVDVLVRRYQRDPVRHETQMKEEKRGVVRHMFWRTERSDRVDVTARLVVHNSPALVFCRTRHGAERLAKQLSRMGIGAAAIHGSRTQPQRERALHAFATGSVQALVATDVAARGIHVDDVSCVVHFDPPGTDKDYVHRSGRTGRAGASGTVVSLVGRENAGEVRVLQRALKLPQRVDSPDVPAFVPPKQPVQREHRAHAANGKAHGPKAVPHASNGNGRSNRSRTRSRNGHVRRRRSHV